MQSTPTSRVGRPTWNSEEIEQQIIPELSITTVSTVFLTGPLDSAPSQCYYHQFTDNSGATLRKTDCSVNQGQGLVHEAYSASTE